MKKISHKIPFRRTLAIICAATIAMLQCAVLLAVEPVHGAETITVNAHVGENNTTTDAKEPSEGTPIPTEDGTKTGYQISSVVGSFGIPTGNITEYTTGSNPINKGDYLVENESGNYDIYRKNGDTYSPTGSLSGNTIDVTMAESYWPVDFSINPSSFNVTEGGSGQVVKANITWNGSFFEKDKTKYIDIKWARTAGPGEVKFSTTSGDSTTVTFSKAGTFKITATNNKRDSQVKTASGEGKKAAPKKKDMSRLDITVPSGNKDNNNKPKPIVKDGSYTLIDGTDYTLRYNRDTKKGIGYVTIIAKPNSSKYTNEVTKTFRLAKIEDKKEEKKENKKENKKEFKSSDVTIKVKSGERIKTNDSPSEIKKKLSVSVDNVASPLKSSQWELIEYDKNKDEATIRTKIDGYANMEVTKKVKTSRYYSNNNNNNNNSGRTFTFRRPSNASSSPSTGTTVPNVTYAPDRTITVKEVYLGEKIEDEPQTDPMDGTMTEPMDGTESTDYSDAMDVETPPLQFGPAAGSAAVAAAAAGAGAVGRIRRFKLDTATEAVEQVTNSEE